MLARADDSPNGLSDTMDSLLQLRTAVGDRLSGVKKDLDGIVGFFKSHEEDQMQRGGVLLSKGVSFFEALLKFDAAKIMLAIEEDIGAL